MRSSKNWQPDLRCCICRAHCPCVVVTKAAAADSVNFADMPAANSHQEWQARGYYWYCNAMAAYFDDMQQYKAGKAIASGTLSSCDDVVKFLIHIVF
ncbi:hypothetical protein E2562_037532 [Oryza meyeriana var. granulata]|uniref:Uncharacterized protein n=1 Tax=Oryza meyeriana var. granulata TaxID=110450 RepID=A0A6G1E8T4_9ORYZ|nr:hypothetical protein E2562_037532 [Oryza meyeriana var. granulata]